MKTGFQKTFSWLLLIVSFAIIAAWAFLAFKNYAFKEEVAQIRGEISAAESRDAYLYSVRNVLRGNEGGLEELSSRFIEEDGVPAFIDFLEKEAASYGLSAEIGALNIEGGKGGEFKTLKVRVSVKGIWKDTVSFIHRIDTMPHALSIDRVALSKAENVWTGAIDISQYIK